MKIEIVIPVNVADIKKVELPKYASGVINLINSTAKATSPRSIGNLSLLKENFKGQTLEEFKKFILDYNPNIIETAIDKILNKASQMQIHAPYINYYTVKNWVENLIFVDTFKGFYFETLCFKIISKKFNINFVKGTINDESKTIDGYLNNKPYNIKPSSHKHKHNKSSEVKCGIIYYTIKENILEIEYDEI